MKWFKVFLAVFLAGNLLSQNLEWINYNTSNSGLPYDDVNSIAIDQEGNKWIGTDGGGVAKFDGLNWTVYNTSNSGLPYDDVNSIAIDQEGNKWIGTDGGGVAKFDGLNWTVYNTSNSGLPYDDVNSIAIDQQGNKWIGTVGGLGVYREGGVHIFYISPGTVNFGILRVGANRIISVVLKNFGSTVTITGVSGIDTSVFRVLNSFPIVVNSGDSVELIFRFNPLSSGVYRDTCVVETSLGNLFVYLEGRGVRAPYVKSSVYVLNFGSIPLGNSLVNTIWIKNEGELDSVRVSRIEFDNNFYLVGSVPGVIGPGDSAEIRVGFRADAVGFYSGEMRFISDAVNETLRVGLRAKVLNVVLSSFAPVQSNIVKFVYRVRDIDLLSFLKFEYSKDGSVWIESSNVWGNMLGISGTKTDTIYWDSKKDISGYESKDVKVRFLVRTSDWEGFVFRSVGVDNKAPSFSGVKSHSFYGIGIILRWDGAIDISHVVYKVSFVDTVEKVYRFIETTSDSVLIDELYSTAGYDFYVRCYDSFGNSGDSIVYKVKLPFACDYNGDGYIDSYDLGFFIKGWADRNYFVCDLYPYFGRIPFIKVVGDTVINVDDLQSFILHWDYTKRGYLKVMEFELVDVKRAEVKYREGSDFVEVVPVLSLPVDLISGGIRLRYDVNLFRLDSIVFRFEGIVLTHNDSLNGFVYVDFARGGGFKLSEVNLVFKFKLKGKPMGEGNLVMNFSGYDENFSRYLNFYVFDFLEIPKEFALRQNYPNPFNPTTTIEFDLPEKVHVRLVVYDVLGREIKRLFDEELGAGKYEVKFDASNLSSGVYFYVLDAGKFRGVKKMVLMK